MPVGMSYCNSKWESCCLLLKNQLRGKVSGKESWLYFRRWQPIMGNGEEISVQKLTLHIHVTLLF